MKKQRLIIIFCMFLFILPCVSSMLIFEVESNPPGSDSGNEWIEFYSSDEMNLTGYTIENNDGGQLNLTETFTGYYVYQFSTQWLDNIDEKVILSWEGTIIQETPLFDDQDDDSISFSYCNSTFSWEFIESTKNQENNCPQEDPPTNTTNSTTNNTNFSNSQNSEPEEDEEESQPQNQEEIETTSNQNVEKKQTQTIKLNSKTPEEQDPKPLNNKNYSPYYLLIFCFLLALLYLLKERNKKTKRKNEFR